MPPGGALTAVGNFFEMSKPDAERALEIYRQFAKQTDFVVSYLRVARQFEHHTRVQVPKLKHAPVNLKQQLEEYVNDPDFEVNRRQYIAEVQAKKSGGSTGASKSAPPKHAPSSSFPDVKSAPMNAPVQSQPAAAAAKPPAADLIDFFGSIDQPPAAAPQAAPQQQVPMQTGFVANGQQQPVGFQQNGFNAQQTFSTNPYQTQQGPSPAQNLNPWGQPQQQQQQQQPQPLQPSFTGAGFGGFSPQPSFTPGALGSIPQDNVATFQTGMQNTLQTPQTTNPFRASMMLQQQQTGMMPQTTMSAPTSPPTTGGLQRQSTNPFARSSSQPPQTFGAPPSTSPSPFQTQTTTPAPLVPMATGTNPFAKNFGGSGAQANLAQRPATSAGPLAPQPTGTTNPFRQASFMNHQTGLGWQHNQQVMGGGLDQMQTTPVFPRPAQQTPWQQ